MLLPNFTEGYHKSQTLVQFELGIIKLNFVMGFRKFSFMGHCGML